MSTGNRFVDKLPDAYRKDPDSNNYKLLSLNEEAIKIAFSDAADTERMCDLDWAFGQTLSYYGEMVDQPRGILDDDRYRYFIRNKIERNLVGGNYQDVYDALLNVFEIEPDQLALDDDPNNPATVHIYKLPLDILLKLSMTTEQAVWMIKLLLPIGVAVTVDSFEGTFEFGAEPGEYDEEKGFGDGETDIGGYLGAALGEETSQPLPI